MLKIESANSRREMVSRNCAKTDGLPPLKGPSRRKQQKTGRIHTARHLDKYLQEEGKTKNKICLQSCYFTYVQHPWSPSRREQETHGERLLKNILQLSGNSIPVYTSLWALGPTALPDPLALQGSPSKEAHAPALTLFGVPGFTAELK